MWSLNNFAGRKTLTERDTVVNRTDLKVDKKIHKWIILGKLYFAYVTL